MSSVIVNKLVRTRACRGECPDFIRQLLPRSFVYFWSEFCVLRPELLCRDRHVGAECARGAVFGVVNTNQI